MPVFLATAMILAHSWYPKACCSDNDCHPIPCEEVRSIADNWVYQGYKFPKNAAQSSQDGACHVCISRYKMPLCIFLGGTS